MDAIKDFSLIKVIHMSLHVSYLFCEERIHLLFMNMYQLTTGGTWWLPIAKFGCQVVHNHYVFKNPFAFIAKYGRIKEYCHMNNDVDIFLNIYCNQCIMYIHAIMPHVHISTTHYGIHLHFNFQLCFPLIQLVWPLVQHY